MRVAGLVVAMCASACTVGSFDYQATVMFSPNAGALQLNHRVVAPGTVWAASYSSFADALRDPSVVEIGEHTRAIGPDACATACAGCDFDRAELVFVLDADPIVVTGTCAGERVVEIR
jgi:hypothetical protein